MKTKSAVYDITVTAVFAALIAVCSWITIPIGEVPFTMQTFAVCCAAGLLGAKRGVTATLIYIILGAVGVPVFSGFRGGIGVIMGTTGGYIIGFLLTALCTGIFSDKFNKKLPALISGMVLGTLLCYTLGTAWYMVVYTAKTGAVGVSAVLMNCVVPFIIPDAAKISVAAFAVSRLKNIKYLSYAKASGTDE